MLVIRPATDADRPDLLECTAALQAHELSLEPGRADPGVAEAYLAELLGQCRNGLAEILVAEVEGRVAGWVGVVPHYLSDDLQERNREFAYITDLIVLDAFRGKGIGRRLLEEAEALAASRGARHFRVGVLSANRDAHRVYRAAGFRDYEITLTKEIGG